MSTIKIRAKESGGMTTVKTLMNHPMETGLRKDKKTGNKIPAHFIQEVTAVHKGTTVMTAYWGTAISKNPYMSFKFSGAAKGDKITVNWTDNKGESDSAEATIK